MVEGNEDREEMRWNKIDETNFVYTKTE